ncbi:MAG: octanoyltransferase, partial [Chloroflexota bacterium]
MTARPFDYPATQWRLLITEPTDGPLNMAIDEVILLGVAEGASPPTLRFFAWAPPCLSLGYSQPVTDVDMDRVKARGYGLVRRPTGGKAILHTDELTYSVITPQTDPRVAGGIVESYRRLSEGLLRGLALMDLIARNDSVYTTENTEHTEKEGI